MDKLGGDRAETKPSTAGHRCAFSSRKDKPKFSPNIEAKLKIPSVAMQRKERLYLAALYRLSEKPVKS